MVFNLTAGGYGADADASKMGIQLITGGDEPRPTDPTMYTIYLSSQYKQNIENVYIDSFPPERKQGNLWIQFVYSGGSHELNVPVSLGGFRAAWHIKIKKVYFYVENEYTGFDDWTEEPAFLYRPGEGWVEL